MESYLNTKEKALRAPTVVAQEIGQRIRYLRSRKQLTQEQFAKCLGLQQSTISQIEAGNVMLSLHSLRTLSQKLRVTYDWLLDGTGLPDRSPWHVAMEGGASPWTVVPVRRSLAGGDYRQTSTMRIPQEDCLLLPHLPNGPMMAFEIPDDSFAPCLFTGDLAIGIPADPAEATQKQALYTLVQQEARAPILIETVPQTSTEVTIQFRKEPDGRIHSLDVANVMELWSIKTRLGSLR